MTQNQGPENTGAGLDCCTGNPDPARPMLIIRSHERPGWPITNRRPTRNTLFDLLLYAQPSSTRLTGCTQPNGEMHDLRITRRTMGVFLSATLLEIVAIPLPDGHLPTVSFVTLPSISDAMGVEYEPDPPAPPMQRLERQAGLRPTAQIKQAHLRRPIGATGAASRTTGRRSWHPRPLRPAASPKAGRVSRFGGQCCLARQRVCH